MGIGVTTWEAQWKNVTTGVKATTCVRKRVKTAELNLAVMTTTAAFILTAMNTGRITKNHHALKKMVGWIAMEILARGTKSKLNTAKSMEKAIQLPTENRPWNLAATAKRETQVAPLPMKATFARGKRRTRFPRAGWLTWVLTALSTKTVGFFEQKGGRCRGAWGEKPGNDGLTAQEVCCVCRFGNIAQHWGRTINNDGTDYNDASKETKVGEMPGMDEELDGLMDKNGGRSMSGTFARTATPELTPTDFAVYGFAVVGLIAAGRAAYVSCGALAKTSTHTAIPDQEI